MTLRIKIWRPYINLLRLAKELSVLVVLLETTRLHQETQRSYNTRNVITTIKQPSDSIITSTRPTKPVDPTRAVVPTYATYEDMLEDDTHASKNRSFPEYSACPYQGLRKPLTEKLPTHSQSIKCRRRKITLSDCTETVKYFGQHGTLNASQCDTNNAIKICTISERKNCKREEIKVSCDASVCKGKRVSLGLFNDTIGKIKWRSVRHINRLNKLLKNHVMSSEFGPGFALLKCDGRQGIQVLSFPKILDCVKAVQEKKRRRFNINIVLQDCLSRAHFYRTLLKTASTFRNIIYNQSIPSTLLEFIKVQSYGTSTYINLQRMFTGQKYWTAKNKCDVATKELLANDTKIRCTLGVEEMLSRYKKAGYSTLLQGDDCWLDNWGSLLDPRIGLPCVTNEKERLARWNDYLMILKKLQRWDAVDDFGMSILSCDVYKTHNLTNPYSSKTMPKICFAGRHYSSYLLEYVKRYTELNDMATQPFFAYTHLLTSHDTNGRRVVDDDEGLADFFRYAAHLRNTVTVFMSDHGGKASKFAAFTNQGREEVFQPVLFMIVPNEVSKMLGPKAMDALVVNQNRLVGVEDLYHSLVSIIDTYPKSWGSSTNNLIQHPNSNQLESTVSRADADFNGRRNVPNVRTTLTGLSGLFKRIPLNRKCEQMKLTSEVLCLCDSMDNTISNDSQTVQWAAEFALGTLNNRIQEQYTTALSSKSGGLASGFYGYGACQRYRGTKILRARQANFGSKQKLLFSLLATPFDRKTPEVFDVDVSFATNQNGNGITLNSLIRVSQFNKYEKCTDKGVDPKLCACHPDQRNNTLWRNELYSKTALLENFRSEQKTRILDRCLTIVQRIRRKNIGRGRWQNEIFSYEAVNACPDVTYKLKMRYKMLKTKVSLKHLKSVKLLPRTVTFLLTVLGTWKWSRFSPKFTFKKSKWTE